jgi:hypothetical protein
MNLSAVCFVGLSGRSAQKCKARSNMTKLVYKQKNAIAVQHDRQNAKAGGFPPLDGSSRFSRKFTGAQTVDCYPTEYRGNDARRKSFDNRRRVLHSLI